MESPRRDTSTVGDELVSRSVEIPTPSFRAMLADADAPRTVWTAPDEPTVVGGGTAATLAANGPNRFAAVRDAAEVLFSSPDSSPTPEIARPRLFGGFSFHDDHDGETTPWSGFPGARFVLPRVQVVDTDDATWLTVNAAGPDATPDAVEELLAQTRDQLADLPEPGPIARPPGVASRTRTTDHDAWNASVTAATDRIKSGELRKVVLAQALDCALESDLSVPDVLARLADRYPDCYRFLVEPADDRRGDAAFLGATPERLVRRRGRTVETGALAGTTGRGETPAEDDWLAAELRESEKNAHEHELVADAVRDQLAPLASSVSTGDRTVRRLATVQHLWTPITAELDADDHVLDIVEALHPTPAVGGLPPDRALETIRETEPFERGWYAAPVGWFDDAGNGSFAVALRSTLVTDRTATLFAGVGIVADSDPDAEWDEVELKYRPILDELEREN